MGNNGVDLDDFHDAFDFRYQQILTYKVMSNPGVQHGGYTFI